MWYDGSIKLADRFPSKESRNNFVKLFAQNIPGPGYGFGMDFENLEYGLNADHSHGRIVKNRGVKGQGATGEWELEGTTVRLDLSIIAHVDPFGVDRLRDRMRDVATTFSGEATY